MPNHAASAPRTVRYFWRCYGYERICYALPVPGVRFAYTRGIPVRRLAPRSSFWNATRVLFPPVRDLVHAFNDLVIGARAWIVSHELELPRFLQRTTERHRRAAYDRLAADSCRLILPMSDAARAWMLRRAPASCAEVLAAKARVFTGGVNGPEHYGMAQSDRQRSRGMPLKLAFVGNNAFRKGGQYVLDAFDQLRAGGVHVELTFIGNVDAHSYVVPVTPDAHADLLRRLSDTEGVTWIRRASNREVLAALAEAHIGLLPTLDDSLGWSVIEMMAAGLPVVASNVVALPELITDGVTGKLIDLPHDEDRRWVGVTAARGDGDVVEDARHRLVTGMIDAIAALDADEALRMRWGAAGRVRYEQRFTPAGAAARLGEIYDVALGEV